MVQSDTGLEQQQAAVRRRVEKDRQAWKERLRVLEQRHFACEADALVACTEAKKGAPPWLKLDFQVQVSARYVSRGRPRSGTVPDQHIWTIRGMASVVEAAVQAEVARKAKFIVATNVPAKRQEC